MRITTSRRAATLYLLALATGLFGLVVLPAPQAAAVTSGITSGINGRIVFTSTRDGNEEIYRMNPDGTGQTRLTNNSARDTSPAFSPDGTRIVFTRESGDDVEIWVMNADGTRQTRLTSGSRDRTPTYSPDGARIVFIRAGGADFIHVMNADGTGVRNVNEMAGSYPFVDAPAFSPDGTHIVFAWTPDFEDFSGINVAGVDVDDRRNVLLAWERRAFGHPRFSPDGTRIVFASHKLDGDPEIYLINVDGTGLTRLTNNPGNDSLPEFSPDGTRIAFNSVRDGHSGIFQMSADGTGPVTFIAPGTLGSWGPVLGTCHGRAATIIGTPGNDTLTGTPGPDVISGLGGDDTLRGLDGADFLCGGTGVDTVTYADRADQVTANLSGGVGDDGSAADGPAGARDSISADVETLIGGSGDDILTGGWVASKVVGGSGNDTLDGDRQADTLSGGAGNDTILGAGGDDVVSGGAGNDTVSGGAGADVVSGGEGNDMLTGGLDADLLNGGPGTDTVTYADHLAAVTVTIGSGVRNDGNFTDGPAGHRDHVSAQTERVIGGPGDDFLAGNGLDNRLTGGAGADSLFGQAGRDTLVAIDGGFDTAIDCGADDDNPAQVDPIDPTPVSCP